MEQNDNEIRKPQPMNHAMVMGVELGLWFGAGFIVSAVGMNNSYLGIVSWLITFYIVWGIYRSTQHYRKTQLDDCMTYGQAYSYIIWLFFFASLIGALVKVVYLKWINPEYLDTLYSTVMNIVAQTDAAAADEMADSLRQLMMPVRFSLYYILADMIGGSILALIMSAFLSRRNK